MGKKDIWTIIGFGLLLLGFLSIIFTLVGIRFTFLGFIDNMGKGISFLIYIFMVMIGIIIMYSVRGANSYK
jgi:hypothetical protein